MSLLLTCAQVAELLADYEEGILPLGQLLMVKVHLYRCPECRALLATLRSLPAILGRALAEEDDFQAKAQARARWRFGSLLAEEAARRALSGAGAERVEALIQAIADRTLDPYAAVAEVLKAAGSMPSSL